MVILKGLTGDLSVTVEGRSQTFTDYGVPPAPSPDSWEIFSARTAVFADPDGRSIQSVVSQPDRGKVISRADGRITVNLNEYTDDLSDLAFTYERDNGAGGTEQVAATVTVKENLYKRAGWQKGKFYIPEVDANDAIVVEPIAGTEFVHIAAAGLSQTDIVARHAGSGDSIDNGGYDGLTTKIPRGVLTNANARDAGGALISPAARYGSTQALAVDPENGNLIQRHLRDTNINDGTSQIHILFKRGDTFNIDTILTDTFSTNGYSPLHPNLLGAYGTGPRPFFNGTVFDETTKIDGHNVVAQDLHMHLCSLKMEDIRANHIMDNIKNVGCRSRHEGSTQMVPNFTLRRYTSLDSVPMDQRNGDEFWPDGEVDDFSGSRVNGMQHVLLQKCFISGGGWDFTNGYRADRRSGDGAGNGNKPPEIYSHSVYGDTSINEAYFQDCLFINNGHSAVQVRSGGIVDNMFTAGNNTGFAPIGNGATDPLAEGGRGGWCNWSMVWRYVQSEGGWKDWDGNASTIAGGIQNNAIETSIWDSAVINWAPKPAYTNSTDIMFGQPSFTVSGAVGSGRSFGFKNRNGDLSRPMPLDASTSRFDLIQSNWNRLEDGQEDKNVGSVPQGTRDALSIGLFADGVMASSGEDLRSFDLDYLRTLEAPWELIDDLNNYFLDPFGKARLKRVSTETVRFEPDPGSETPAQLAMFAGDWHTKDLPGTVAGDSVNLQGHDVYWNLTPANNITNFDFGGDGWVEQWGGAIRPTGTVTCDAGGNDLTMFQGSKFDLANTPAGGTLNVTAYESRLSFSGTVSDNWSASIWGRSELLIEEGGDATVASGETLELGGNCKAGFDGSTGSAAALTVAGTLAFKRGCLLRINNVTEYAGLSGQSIRGAAGLPEPGESIASASGATGRVAGVYQLGQSNNIWLFLEDVTGTFVTDEDLFGPTHAAMFFIGDSRLGLGAAGGFPDLQRLGTVHAAPDYKLTTINEFVSGRNGVATPDVASSVTLASGSTVTVDTTGIANGTYDLINVDSLTDSGATLPPGVAVSGNKLVLTI